MVINQARIRRLSAATVSAIAIALMGCTATPHLDEHMGLALKANNDKMIANPEAGTAPNDGVTEIEGATVESTLERYRREQTSRSDQSLPQSILLQGVPSSR